MVTKIEPGRFKDEDLKDVKKVEETLMEMDHVSLRALIRQSAHRIDNGTQRYIISPEETKVRLSNARNTLRFALSAWEKRGYESNKADINYAYEALRRGDEFEKTPVYHDSPPHAPFSEGDLKAVEKAMFERRSVRRFSDRDVPDDLLNKVLGAATWAPCACSLQGCRFIVIKKPESKKLISQPWAAPVIIIAGMDERPYQFIADAEVPYNPYLDLGAAIQNMHLMAHALGLAMALGTYTGEIDLLKRELKIPDYIKIITYFVLGWPADKPTTVPRMELKEFVSREMWSGA